MAKIFGLTIPPELVSLYESALNVSALTGDGKVVVKKMVSPRRVGKMNFMREAFRYFKTNKPFDNIVGQKDSYDAAAHPQGLTNMQGWVSQVGSAVNNNLDRTEEVLTGKRFGRFLKLINPAGGYYVIAQEHPASCYTSRKILGKRGRREIVQINEPSFSSITISFSYKFAPSTIFSNEYTPLFNLDFYSDENLSEYLWGDGRVFIQDNDWHDFSETFTMPSGTASSYRMSISCSDITYLAIDSLNFYHDGINWARDRNCSDVLFQPPYAYNSYGDELVQNPEFKMGSLFWTIEGGYGVWDNGRIRFDFIPTEDQQDAYIWQSFGSTLPNGTYCVKIKCSVPDGIDGYITRPFDTPENSVVGAGIWLEDDGLYIGVGVPNNGNTMQTTEGDFNYGNDPAINGFAFVIGGFNNTGHTLSVYIESVSLRLKSEIVPIPHWFCFAGLGVGSIEQGQIGDVGFD